MRILKPLRLGMLTRPYQYRGRQQLGVSVFAFATLAPEPVLLPEAELWTTAGEVLDEEEALDMAVPKPCAEFLASGKAWSHDPQQPERCAVLVSVAGKEKHLLVTGKRAWVQGRMTEPAAVEGVPVNWRHAYGGPDFAENPVGVGAAVGEGELRWAPQVEAFDDRMTHEHGVCRPVGLSAISPIRPRRFRLSGEFDPSWPEKGFPGFPDTLDPHFFNAASPDQWFTGQSELPPRAPYRIGNMHPQRAVLEGELPGWRGRCFIRRHDEDALEEIALRHTTAWFFPDRERVLLIFQGAAPISTDDASDLEVIMPALDTLEFPRDLAHYQRTLAQRLPREEGALYALRDKDLVPESAMRDLVDMDANFSTPLVVNQRQRADNLRRDMMDRVKEAGQDPAQFDVQEDPVPSMRSLDDLPDFSRQMRRRTREAKARALRQRREADARFAQSFKDAPGGAASASQVVTTPQPGGPPRISDASVTEGFMAMAQRAQATGADGGMTPEKVQAMMHEARERLGQVYLRGAHIQNAPLATPHSRVLRMRRRVETLLAGSRDLSGLDLTGVDLSGLDMSGARCRGVWMEGADLRGASLAGADLREAVLTRAVMMETDCRGADFTSANLGHLDAFDACFAQARFQETTLDEAEFEYCDFTDARIQDCAPSGVGFRDCDFSKARLEAVTFWQDAYLIRGSHAEAVLHRVVWLDSDLEDADYSHARLTACAWVQSGFDTPPVFSHAQLTTCCAVETDLEAARFDHAHLKECSLRDIALDGADFTGARLQRCDFSESTLRDAIFTRADARESIFMEADLQGATLREADLIDTLMQKSDFRHADLRGANLFRADISQGRLDDSTRTDGAYVKFAKTLPVAPAGETA